MSEIKQEKKAIDSIWEILNQFRLHHFFTSSSAEIEASEFDDMMDRIRELFQ